MNAIETLNRLAADIPLAKSVESPDWRNSSQTWVAYVPKELHEVWADLPPEAKMMAVILGDELVSRERWD